MTAKQREALVPEGEPEPAASPATKALPAAARRSLKEAEERRKAAGAEPARPLETGGRDGPEPTRYGDWEKGGIASDF